MFAVITNPNFWYEIEQAVNSKGEDILYKRIDKEINIFEEIEKISRIPVRILIIDISCIEDQKKIPQAIRRFRIKNDNARIIVIAPNCLPGNELLSVLVTMGVYDIISPRGEKPEDMVILPSILDHIEKPASYARAVKWDLNANEINTDAKDNSISNKKDAAGTEKVLVEKTRTLTIEKDRIIGTVVIAVAGTIHRIGTTHTALSIVKFLHDMNYSVAIMEMHNSQNFNFIKNSYSDITVKNDMFTLDGVDYYPYTQSLNVLDVLEEEYNYIIMDMGIYNDCDMVEFKRANERIIVSGVKDWEITDLELILRTGDKIFKNKYLFNFSDRTTFEFIKSNMDNLPCFLASMNPQPFSKSKEASEVFRAILKDVLPRIKQKETKNILSSLKDIIPISLKKKGSGDIEA